MGIGFELVKSVEEWLIGNGAHYTFLATEKNNVASTNLFTSKCNYMNFTSLVIFVQPASLPVRGLSQDIKIEKLQADQAIYLYNNKFRSKDMFPTDVDAILKEKLSIGTWVSYFKEEEWISLHNNEDIVTKTPSSWAMFSIWNSCDAYKLHIRKSDHRPFRFFHATLSHARDKIFPCLKLPVCHHSLQKPFGFLFLFGLYGEGERIQELMKSIWSFASRLAENVKDCRVIISELGVSDPLIEHVPRESSMSFINDLWYLKKVNGIADDSEESVVLGQVIGNVFVDPRDF
ncbi:ACYL-COA N-ACYLTRANSFERASES (NAT) SUPERFAMILY PROTEIN [Salix koriyanagi]|uniref:ACYL-COA N-ACYLTRANSFERASES (NAT) SUPERFAMILY PROTEIN n=1 Tax=Salix koriyanagi TaxID=2511006 RepID=A0A9Q0WS93_9ROSI|nr:ACYL-COA N-ACYLTRANSFERASES (NAT) SUPERFAMILY PROTEIN [Salix koriyanagi]